MNASRLARIILAILLLAPTAAMAGTIVDEWASVQRRRRPWNSTRDG